MDMLSFTSFSLVLFTRGCTTGIILYITYNYPDTKFILELHICACEYINEYLHKSSLSDVFLFPCSTMVHRWRQPCALSLRIGAPKFRRGQQGRATTDN